ncbi:MAG: hypothetical protein KJ886_03425 [Candidatus Thermoplasmatota archaeon]|nr:hypothetical protein [Candidatus Thermoplasmatota archaeon]MCG2827362.1 hypothetical protein [Thermoplasmatales archaeon]
MKVEPDIFLQALDNNYRWKMSKLIMLVRILKERKSFFKNEKPMEVHTIIKDGIILEMIQTVWGLAEDIAACCNAALKNGNTLIKDIVDYETKDIHKFFGSVDKLSDKDIKKILNLPDERQIKFKNKEDVERFRTTIDIAKKSLSGLRNFYNKYYSLMVKYKHGSPLLIGSVDNNKDYNHVSEKDKDYCSSMIGAFTSGKDKKVIFIRTSIEEVCSTAAQSFLLQEMIFKNRNPRYFNAKGGETFVYLKSQRR